MSFLASLDISASALTANRVRMDVISENIANESTTRSENGGPYRRKQVVLSEKSAEPFSSYYNQAIGGGVKVSEIAEDMSDFELVYDPEHVDANEEGYVLMPNVDEVTEIIDMMAVTRAYEANVTVFNATKSMAVKALEIGG